MRFRYPALGSTVLSYGFGLTNPADPNSWGTFEGTAQTVINCPSYLIGTSPNTFCADGGNETLAEGDSGGPVTSARGYVIGINEGFSTVNGDPTTTGSPDVFVSLAGGRNWIAYQVWASR
jgi:hypothetical protein